MNVLKLNVNGIMCIMEKAECERDPVEAERLQAERAEADRILGYSGLGSKDEENDDALDRGAEAKRERDCVRTKRMKREEIMKSENAEELLMVSVKQDLRSQTSNLSITP